MTNADTPAHPADGGMYHLGLTKREAFAMAAMQGLIAASGNAGGAVKYDDVLVAENSVKMADTMLAELAKEGGE